MPSKTLSDIYTEFRLKRKSKLFLNEQKIKEHEEVARIEQQKRAFLADKLALLLQGGDARELDEKIQACEREQKKIIEKDIKLVSFDCTKCNDTGVLDGKHCTCLLNEVYETLYGAVPIRDVEASFERFDLSLFDDTTPTEAGKTQRVLMEMMKSVCQKYVEKYPDTPKNNMLLKGKAGLGKTYLLQCIAKQAQQRDIDVLLIRAGELFQTFFEHRMGEEIPLSFLNNAGLLLIDDLGTEPITQNVSIEYLFDLLNRRMEKKKHTVIATNIDDLKRRYDERISSRLESRKDSIQLLFDGKDVRI